MSNSGFTFRRVREEMIETLLELGIKDFRVLDAISQIPRHIFLDEALWSRAYENRPLTIGYKQTISQPYIVARMTELLISHTKTRGKIFERLLDIGSGCGYQSAVLSFFCEEVDAIERINPLVLKSRENLANLKITNVTFQYGDGYQDWDKKIKYDGILCAAAPREYPKDLILKCESTSGGGFSIYFFPALLLLFGPALFIFWSVIIRESPRRTTKQQQQTYIYIYI